MLRRPAKRKGDTLRRMLKVSYLPNLASRLVFKYFYENILDVIDIKTQTDEQLL